MQLSIKQLITCYSARLSMWTPHVHTSREPRIVLLFDLAPGQNTTLLDIFSKVVWVSQACPLRYTFMIYPSSKLHTHCPCSNCEGTQMPYHFWGDSNQYLNITYRDANQQKILRFIFPKGLAPIMIFNSSSSLLFFQVIPPLTRV